MSQRIQPTATIVVDGSTKQIADGNLTLDVGAVPYATATVELDMAQLTQAQIDWLNPTASRRPVITLGPSAGGPKVLDMGLRGRRLSADGRRVILSLASDEALLQNYAPMTDNTDGYGLSGAVRQIVDNVLDIVLPGSPVALGTLDPPVEPFWEATNLVPNPSVYATVTGYYAIAAGTSAVAYSTATGYLGASSARWTASGTGEARMAAGAYSASPGSYYTASCYVRTGTGDPVRNVQMRMVFRDSENVMISSHVGTFITEIAGANWVRPSVTQLAPPGTAKVSIGVESRTNTAGQFHYADAFLCYQHDYAITDNEEYWDGTNPSAGYTTAWSDVDAASQSYRVPNVDRPLESVIWQAGQSAWDFLMPLLASVNLVLWCTEEGDWWLDSPENRAGGADIIASGATSRTGDDDLSLDGGDNVTGVVVRYVWTQQRTGYTRRRTDTAGVAGNVVIVELAQPYPGPGTAAAILARRQGTGRAQTAEVVIDYAARTGAHLVYTLPGVAGLGLLGQATSIDFDMRSGFMRVTASGTVD